MQSHTGSDALMFLVVVSGDGDGDGDGDGADKDKTLLFFSLGGRLQVQDGGLLQPLSLWRPSLLEMIDLEELNLINSLFLQIQ